MINNTSITGKKWILKDFNHTDIEYLKDNYLLDEITSRLLSIRKIDKSDIQTFLNPAIKNILPNPDILKDMEKSTERAFKSILNKEKIGVFGDYDVDGATSVALIGGYLKLLKHPYETYIPDRGKEGYGPSVFGLTKLISKNCKLIFTVDCGTLSFSPIQKLKTKTDIIILDHHQSDIKLPEAYSIINPNRHDDKSNLNYLCAVGVCFMFLISLNRKLRKNNWFKKNNIKEPDLINFLDLVSLGTICDVVPLIGLNRALVKQGLKVLNYKKNLGIKTLLDICNIDADISTYHLGYVIGPRINAGGRVGKCSHGTNLLLEDDPKKIFKIASELNLYNLERKELEKNLMESIQKKYTNLTDDPVLVLEGENWHEGVIGIIAARLKDKFNKPVIIISKKDKIGKASARSIQGFDIGSYIIAAVQENLLIKGGGHKMAGGFTINNSMINKFKDFIIKKYVTKNIDLSKKKTILIDSEIAPSAVNLEFYDRINTLSPFGSGNPEPIFMIKKIKKINSTIVGDKHIKSIFVGEDGTSIKSISFNSIDNELGSFLLKKDNKTVNIAGKLSLNDWRGKKNVEFIIDDISVNKNNEKMVPSSIG